MCTILSLFDGLAFSANAADTTTTTTNAATTDVSGDLCFSSSTRSLSLISASTFKPNSFNFRGDNLRLFRFVCYSSSSSSTMTTAMSFVFLILLSRSAWQNGKFHSIFFFLIHSLVTSGMGPITSYTHIAVSIVSTSFGFCFVFFSLFFLAGHDSFGFGTSLTLQRFSFRFRFFVFFFVFHCSLLSKSVQLNDDGNRQWERKCHKMPNKTFQLIFRRLFYIMHLPRRTFKFSSICC